ncbi:hypothetical protein LDENG_00286970 [Lucifuga dentata]|nr:hypothetical protein LDENG_00286970 [Lucifuga dentata]
MEHKPLMFALAKVAELTTLSFISEFTTDIQHVAGKHKVVTDCLSRAITRAVHLGLDARMVAHQVSDLDRQ